MVGESCTDVKVILEENKTEFENQLKELINRGYQIKSSNIKFIQTQENIALVGQGLSTNGTHKVFTMRKDEKIKNCFYALLIKE